MASFVKLVYLVIVFSIAADFLSLGRQFLNSGSDSTAVQSSLLFPGADAIWGHVAKAVLKGLSKSAQKAAKKKAKNQAKAKGKQRNKARKAQGKGLCVCCC